MHKLSAPQIRVGNPDGDGGYIIHDLSGSYDCLLSGGIADNIQFEEDFLRRNPGILCFAFDGTIPALPKTGAPICFVNKNLGPTSSDTVTNLNDYFSLFSDIFLKLDIEGHEFVLLPSMFEHMHKVKQIVIEFHTPTDIRAHPDYYKGLANITDETMFEILKTLSTTHVLTHFHPNNGCKVHDVRGIRCPNVFECTYVRKDYAKGAVLNTDPIPSPLDRPNHSWYPEHVLTGPPFVFDVVLDKGGDIPP